MSDRPKIGLDNPAFSGRLRQPLEPARVAAPSPSVSVVTTPVPVTVAPTPILPKPAVMATPEPIEVAAQPTVETVPPPADSQPAAPLPPVETAPTPETEPLAVVKAEPYVAPALPKQQPSQVLHRQFVQRLPDQEKVKSFLSRFHLHGYKKSHVGLGVMAAFIFLTGVAVSLQTLQSNNRTVAAAQLLALSNQKVGQTTTTDSIQPNASAPATKAQSSDTTTTYATSPDLARLIKIPKVGVSARVLPTGLKADGSLGTPDSVFDTSWYSGSARPGQAGATIIDGFRLSGTTQGAFYDIKSLSIGDAIQIERGDKSIINYRIAKTRLINADQFTISLVNTPASGPSGLNIVAYTGRLVPGAQVSSQRFLIYATPN